MQGRNCPIQPANAPQGIRRQPGAMSGQPRHQIGECAFCRPRRHRRQRGIQGRITLCSAQHGIARQFHRFRRLALIHRLKIRCDAGLQREAAQNRLAETVNGADAQSAWKIQHLGKQASGPRQFLRCHCATIQIADCGAQRPFIHASPF